MSKNKADFSNHPFKKYIEDEKLTKHEVKMMDNLLNDINYYDFETLTRSQSRALSVATLIKGDAKRKSIMEFNKKAFKIKDFLIFCRLVYNQNPGNYGSAIEKKIIMDFNLKKIEKYEEQGDCMFKNGKKAEVKASYTNKNNLHSLLHIKPYQDYDYYVIILVDADDKFKPHFYIINKEDLNKKNFKGYAFSNGSDVINKQNKNPEYRLTISKRNRQKLNELNLLDDTSIKSFKKFINKK